MRFLIACESSRKVAQALEALGHQAMSCDLLPADVPGWHYQGDVRDVLGEAWDGLIAHPPCTYVSSSGLHWVKRGRIEADGRPRAAHVAEAIAFARMLIDGPEVAHIPRRVIENPIGCLSTQIRKPDQIVHPYLFGDDASKSTCLWLVGVDRLTIDPAARKAGRMVDSNGKTVERWANQTDAGQNVLGPSADRWKLRSETYPGIAAAVALAMCSPAQQLEIA